MYIRGDTHMTSTLRGMAMGVGERQKWDVIGRRGWGFSECSGRPIFIFFIKENWISSMTRHVEPNNILLTRNLSFDSGVRKWSLPLIIPLHYLWAKSNNRKRGQFECDLIWFCFSFDFVHMHGAVVVL